MIDRFQVAGLTRVYDPKPNKSGDTILAYFDCLVGPIELRGCALTQRQKSSITVLEPKVNDLRTDAVIRLLQHGYTHQQIFGMVGISMKMIDIYCRHADRKAGGRAVLRKLKEHKQDKTAKQRKPEN